MRPKSLLLLTLALGCGLVASIGISQVLDRKAGQGPAMETEAIFVAGANINLGDKITEEVLNLEDWPKDKVPPGSIRKMEDLVGRHPRTKIYQGEPILDVKLVAADGRDDPAQQIPAGYRVTSIRVDAHTGGAGLLRPGDRVDVQLYTKKDLRTGVPRTGTKTILREIRVFAVEQEFRRDKEGDDVAPPRTVSLVVTPEQADKLALATRLGEINLTIRNPDDTVDIRSDGASIDDLFVASRADRDEERASPSDVAEAGSSFVDFLKQIKTVGSSVTPPPSLTEQVASAGPWTILILEGSDVRQVQVTEDGPLAPDGTAAGSAGIGPFGLPPARSASPRGTAPDDSSDLDFDLGDTD